MFMAKRNVMITLDEELHDKCKENFLNISGEVASALRNRLNAPKVEEVIKCGFCGSRGEKETANEVLESERKCKLEDKEGKALNYSNPTSLTWLENYQQWICNKCLRTAIGKLNSN